MSSNSDIIDIATFKIASEGDGPNFDNFALMFLKPFHIFIDLSKIEFLHWFFLE